MNGKVTYRQQYTRCGKQRCRKCKEGAGHGPYWYAYWSENGRTISKYIGIHLPDDLARENPALNSAPKKASTRARQEDRTLHLSKISSAQNDTSERAAVQMETAEAKRERANILPDSRNSQSLLRVYLLGQFRVERKEGASWQTVENRTWQRRRARALLGCLLSQTGRRMGREQVMEALWPDLDIETAANRLNGAVHELRQILEPGIERPASSKLLRLERDILILADVSYIWVDAEAFEVLLNRASTSSDPELIEGLLESAWALYEGDYLLEELYSEWATARRESLRRGWMGLLLKLAELRAERSALISAIEPLDRLLAADPTHETAVRRLMLLLTQLDRRGEAIRVYERLAAALKRDYESEPLAETVELYKTLRQGPPQDSRLPSTSLLEDNQSQSDMENSPAVTRESNHVSDNSQDLHAGEHLVSWHTLHHPTLPSGRHNQSPLSGRESELEAILQILRSIHLLPPQNRNGEKQKMGKVDHRSLLAHFVMIMGETGIGKTRLAEEIAQEALALGWRIAWTRAYEQEGTIPYRLWTDILRTLLQDVPLDKLIGIIQGNPVQSINGAVSTQGPAATAQAKLNRLSALLPEIVTSQDLPPQQKLLTPSLSPEQERFHLWETMLTILNALSQSTPLLLVLDDLHWADDSSLELLAYLGRHQQNEHIMLIGTCRDRELTPSATLRALLNDLRREGTLASFPLEPLTQAQIARLLAHLPHELVRGIQSQAGGNPLFAEELARFSETTQGKRLKEEKNDDNIHSLVEENKKGTGRGKRPAALPETIAAVLERRLHELSTDCQTLLSKAAVLGGSFEFGLLLHLIGEGDHGEDHTLDLLEEALRSGLLTEEVTGTRIVYHFWHPLIVSHLYERLSAARRAQLHRRTAEALIDLHKSNPTKGAAAVAHHLDKYSQDKQRLAHYAEIAGNQAMVLSAHPEALHYYRMALEARQALQATMQATEQDPMHLANLLECMADCNSRQGRYEEARQQYAQVLELHRSQQKDPLLFSHPEAFLAWQREEIQIQGLIWRSIGRSWRNVGEYSQAHACAEQGRRTLHAAGITSGITWACLQNLDGSAYWVEGNFTEAKRYLEEALTILEESTRTASIPPSGRQMPQDNVLPPLMTNSQRALLGDPIELSNTHDSLGVVALSMGQHAEALHHLQIALTILEEHDLVGMMSHVCDNLGVVHAMKAEYAIADTYFQRALQFAERTSDIPSKIRVISNLGDIAARTGDLQAATAWLMEALALAEQIYNRHFICWVLVALATSQQNLGEMRKALEHIRRALAAERDLQNPTNAGAALIALADWRAISALMLRKPDTTSLIGPAYRNMQSSEQQRLLRSARAAVERALALEGIDVETRCTGQAVQATISYYLGDLEHAREQANQALTAVHQSGLIYLIGHAHRLLGEIQSATGCYQEADASFAEALQIFKKYEMRLNYARALQCYGSSLLERSWDAVQKHKVANSTETSLYSMGLICLREARDLFEACQARFDLQAVEHILADPTLLNMQLLKGNV